MWTSSCLSLIAVKKGPGDLIGLQWRRAGRTSIPLKSYLESPRLSLPYTQNTAGLFRTFLAIPGEVSVNMKPVGAGKKASRNMAAYTFFALPN